MQKKFLILAIAVLLVCSFSSTVMATPYINSSGQTLKWSYSHIDTQHNVRCLDVTYNGDYLTSNWIAQLPTADSNWDNNSNYRTNFSSTTYSSSKLKFASWTTWPTYFGSGVVAATNTKDPNGYWMWDFDTGDYYYALGPSIVEAHVYTNPAYDDNSYIDASWKQLVLAHEMGHVLMMAHPPAGTASIMTQGQKSYWTPQWYDRNELATIYPVN